MANNFEKKQIMGKLISKVAESSELVEREGWASVGTRTFLKALLMRTCWR